MDLLTEPFNLRPDEVAKLTDWQILHMFRRQAEKVRAAREAHQARKLTTPETARE